MRQLGVPPVDQVLHEEEGAHEGEEPERERRSATHPPGQLPDSLDRALEGGAGVGGRFVAGPEDLGNGRRGGADGLGAGAGR
jgi:hypothetical protein